MNIFKRKPRCLPKRSLDDLKGICRVLFIDDKEYDTIDIVKTNGWRNTTHITDLEAMDQPEVRDAHIIFVDIQGIGKKMHFKDEGLAVVKALKETYGDTKRIIVYSAEEQGRVEAFHPGMDAADACLKKTDDPYLFLSKIERFAKELLTYEQIKPRIKRILQDECGIAMSDDDIDRCLERLLSRNTVNADDVAKAFNVGLQVAGSLASLISMFLR